MTHSHEKIEIGYLFKKNELNVGDYTKDVPSIQALLDRTGKSIPEILSGDQSLGSMFENEGHKSIPSSRQPTPGKDKYYRGGHITQIHGSRDGGLVDAIQTEFPWETLSVWRPPGTGDWWTPYRQSFPGPSGSTRRM